MHNQETWVKYCRCLQSSGERYPTVKCLVARVEVSDDTYELSGIRGEWLQVIQAQESGAALGSGEVQWCFQPPHKMNWLRPYLKNGFHLGWMI
jgi:hypothetical protein